MTDHINNPMGGRTEVTDQTPAAAPEEDAPRQVKPFAQLLQEQRNGALHAELSEQLAAVVAACQQHGKAGAVTLTISVKPNKDAAGTLMVTDVVKVKKPEGERPAALFFADSDGNLSRQDPRQLAFDGPLRKVPGGAQITDQPLRKAE